MGSRFLINPKSKEKVSIVGIFTSRSNNLAARLSPRCDSFASAAICSAYMSALPIPRRLSQSPCCYLRGAHRQLPPGASAPRESILWLPCEFNRVFKAKRPRSLFQPVMRRPTKTGLRNHHSSFGQRGVRLSESDPQAISLHSRPSDQFKNCCPRANAVVRRRRVANAKLGALPGRRSEPVASQSRSGSESNT
jgi:hypothetical protein